ncbi:conserved hypothetical protein [Roseovarius sp. EC-HK134]|nr:conserved hypothetical protein [Roseovarius sp. EC-HK134]VVT11958.1 conserved hypothetical protein [Roseovarius sp. EC-SD190]
MEILNQSSQPCYIRGDDMLRTVQLGSCVSIQGIFVRLLSNGLMQVRVGSRLYSGRPVEQRTA